MGAGYSSLDGTNYGFDDEEYVMTEHQFFDDLLKEMRSTRQTPNIMIEGEPQRTKLCFSIDGIKLIDKSLGRGSFGTVYAACFNKDCGNYAFKVMIAKDERYMDYLRQDVIDEARMQFEAAAAGVGPKIYRIIECDKDKIGILMERFDGRLYMRDMTPETLRKLQSAVKRLHDLGIIHGDLKYGNVLVNRDKEGNVTDLVLADFGYSVKMGEKDKYDRLLRSYNHYYMDKGHYSPYYKHSIATGKSWPEWSEDYPEAGDMAFLKVALLDATRILGEKNKKTT